MKHVMFVFAMLLAMVMPAVADEDTTQVRHGYPVEGPPPFNMMKAYNLAGQDAEGFHGKVSEALKSVNGEWSMEFIFDTTIIFGITTKFRNKVVANNNFIDVLMDVDENGDSWFVCRVWPGEMKFQAFYKKGMFWKETTPPDVTRESAISFVLAAATFFGENEPRQLTLSR